MDQHVLPLVKLHQCEMSLTKKFKTVAPSAKIIDLQLQVKICQANIADNMLKVTNSTADGLTTWSGTHCASLRLTDMSIDMSKAVSIMSSLPLVDTQSIQLSLLPYHPSLAVTVQTGDATTKVPCRLCEERVETKVMCKHVGKHILKDNLGIVCGFCGLGTCSIDLVRGSGRGKTVTFVPGSNCEYLVKFSLKSAENQLRVVRALIDQ